MKPEEKALLGYLHHVRNTKPQYRPSESLTRHVGQAIYKNRDEQRKALRGILHHNDAVKSEFKLPESLIRHVKRALGEEGGLEGIAQRGHPVGTRVRFEPTRASLRLYSQHPAVGEEGSVTKMPGFGSRTFLPGPGGGLLYVKWDRSGTIGISPIDLSKVGGVGKAPPPPPSGFNHERTPEDYKARIAWEAWAIKKARADGMQRDAAEHELAHQDYIRNYQKKFGGSSAAAFQGVPGLDEFTQQYIKTALWSSTDNSNDQGGDPLDDNYGIEDIDDKSLKKMVADCQKFQKEHWNEISSKPGLAGHDFWLTRNGHGAGFWDGDWPDPLGDVLTEASEKFGSQDIYVGDDGKLYVS